jgi:hypothetical protein
MKGSDLNIKHSNLPALLRGGTGEPPNLAKILGARKLKKKVHLSLDRRGY